MRHAFAVVLLLLATASQAEPVFLDQLVEMPLTTLQTYFPGLKKEGCYRLADGRFLLVAIDKKDGKPWRIVLASDAPCRRPDDGPALDVQQRKGVQFGDSTVQVVEKMGRPDAAAEPETALKRLGETEYFYICRVSEGCARHTSIFIRAGLVSAIAEWYSD